MDYFPLVRMKMNEALSQGARFTTGASHRIHAEYMRQAESLGIQERLRLLHSLITAERTDGGHA